MTATPVAEPATELEPFTASMSWSDACHPNHQTFADEATPAMLAWMVAHQLSFTHDDDDYTVRHSLLPALEKSRDNVRFEEESADEYELLDELIDLVEQTLCPECCCDCGSEDLSYVLGALTNAVHAHEAALGSDNVYWLVTDDNGECLEYNDWPDGYKLRDHYIRRHDYNEATLKVELDGDKFAELQFDYASYHVWAFTDPTDRRLIDHLAEASYEDAELAEVLNVSQKVRASMWDLVERFPSTDMPEKLRVNHHNPRRQGVWKSEVTTCFGTIAEAEAVELVAVAEPLVDLDDETIELAMTLLPEAPPNWGQFCEALTSAN